MKKRVFIIFYIFLIICFAFSGLKAREINRPTVWGIAKMTFLVSDFQLARDYYGKFLGFDEALSYPSPEGKVVSFKINDRQFLEFIEDKDARKKNRLIKISFDCDEIQQIHDYLATRDVVIVTKPDYDPAGNISFTVLGPDNHMIEYIHFMPESLHKKTKGRFLSENRISKRIHHAGLYISDVEKANRFFKEILGFSEMWRSKPENAEKPICVYLRMPDCIENIEYLITDEKNPDHTCFLLEDMQESIYTLKDRANGEIIRRPGIGRGDRWLLNLEDADQTCIEFTEAHTIR